MSKRKQFNRKKELRKATKEAKEILEKPKEVESIEDWLDNLRKLGLNIPENIEEPKEILKVLKEEGVPIGSNIKADDLTVYRHCNLTEEGILNQLRKEEIPEAVISFYMTPFKRGGSILADFTSEEGWFELFEKFKKDELTSLDLFHMILNSHLNIQQGLVSPEQALRNAVMDNLEGELGYQIACALAKKLKDAGLSMDKVNLTLEEIDKPGDRKVWPLEQVEEWRKSLAKIKGKKLADKIVRYKEFDELMAKIKDEENQDFESLLNPIVDLCLEEQGIALYTITVQHTLRNASYGVREVTKHLVECNPYQILEEKVADKYFCHIKAKKEPFLRDKALELRRLVFNKYAKHLGDRF